MNKENSDSWKELIHFHDAKRYIAVCESQDAMIHFCVEQFIEASEKAIENTGVFAVALSGGSTPKRIFQSLTSPKNRNRVQWEKLLLFWGDERAVPADHPDSNYRMAIEAGFGSVPIAAKNIFRMVADNDIDENARRYEQIIKEKIPSGSFDLVMLGMGEDGHTASLFPKTHALDAEGRLVVSNYVPEIDAWRMTLTFEAINSAKESVIYVMGKAKAALIAKIFDENTPCEFPIENIGSLQHPALWVLDKEAASELKE